MLESVRLYNTIAHCNVVPRDTAGTDCTCRRFLLPRTNQIPRLCLRGKVAANRRPPSPARLWGWNAPSSLSHYAFETGNPHRDTRFEREVAHTVLHSLPFLAATALPVHFMFHFTTDCSKRYEPSKPIQYCASVTWSSKGLKGRSMHSQRRIWSIIKASLCACVWLRSAALQLLVATYDERRPGPSMK